VASSVAPETLLAGKVVGVGAIWLAQQIIWVVGTVVIGKTPRADQGSLFRR